MPAELAALCREHRVLVHEQGPYAARLAALCPEGWPTLVDYPLLHKFLNFGELARTGARQILFCDCDTVFFTDVALLFDRYGDADVVAREEVHSGRSIHGADRTFIDEPLLARLAAADGAAVIPPFNLGVVLFNHDVCASARAAAPLILDYAWRFIPSLAPPRPRRATAAVPRRPTGGSSTRWCSGSPSARCPASGPPTSFPATSRRTASSAVPTRTTPAGSCATTTRRTRSRIAAWLAGRPVASSSLTTPSRRQPWRRSRARPSGAAQRAARAKASSSGSAGGSARSRSAFPDRIFANASPHSIGGVSLFEAGVVADAGRSATSRRTRSWSGAP